jgi:hypothetical protein
LEGLKHWGTIEFGRAWADHMEATYMRPSEAEVRAMAKWSRQTCTPT